jgi:hypothetical protein
MQNLMQARCSILPSTAELGTLKEDSCKNNACSQPGVTWQTDAIGLWKCDFGFPLHLLSSRQLTIVAVRELSDSIFIACCSICTGKLAFCSVVSVVLQH